MAQKLSVQIELDGAAEIERQLENLGETGKKAFAELEKAADKVGGFAQLDPTEVTKKLEDMGITGVDAINQIQDAVQQAGKLEGLVEGVQGLENAFGALGKVIRPLGGEIRKIRAAVTTVYAAVGPFGVAGVAAFAAISTSLTVATKLTIGFAESINKVNNEAIKLGVGVAQLDQFRAGLEKAGVSAESVGKILQSKLATEQGVSGLESFIRQLEQMPDSVERSKAAVEQFGDAGAELIRILQTGSKITGFTVGGLISAEDAKKATELGQALNRLETAYNRLSTVSAAPTLTAGINAATSAVQTLGQRLEATPWGTLLIGAQLVFNPIQGLVQAVSAAITQLITNLRGVGTEVEQVGIKTAQASTQFTSFGTLATQAATQPISAFKTLGVTAAETGQQAAAAGQTAASGWDVLLNKIREYFSLVGTQAATGAQIGIGGMASGGLLGGRGTGTSDSNLAWLSRGEYVTPARAVAQPGVLSFLEALRRSGGNLSRVLDGMGRFALGGLVRAPAFAAGGLAGGNNVTIQFPGLPAIGGLRASSGVVDQLQKAAALAQVRSGGRKPSRYS